MSDLSVRVNRPRPAWLAAVVRFGASAVMAAMAAAGVGLGAVVVTASLASGTSSGDLDLLTVSLLAAVLFVATLRLHGTRAELARRRAQVRALERIDPLTGTRNRHAFNEDLDRHFRPGAELVLMLLDIDNLRSVNDSLGQGVGDALLKQTAERIRFCLRTTDVVSRLSGDQFAVLLPRLDPGYTEVVARRIAEAVRRPHSPELHSCTVSASLGIVVLGNETTPGELLRNAELALAAAKLKGRGHSVVYRADLHASEVERIAFERDLRTALDQRQFVLHYQPIVDSKTRRILGVEALVRWSHPERGLLPPVDFLPVAESTGLIIPLGAWALREACMQTQRWRVTNSNLFSDFVVTVNVSARQLFGTQLQDDVVAALDESGLAPRHLVLEIIESQVMTDLAAALRQISALKELGVRIAIDDFGTGYSSLGHLQDLPVDYLKLDKTFTDNIAESSKSQELMRTVAQLSRNLAIDTVAEGVETAAQAEVLQDLDVSLCQGYFFRRPADAESIGKLLGRAQWLPEEPSPWGPARVRRMHLAPRFARPPLRPGMLEEGAAASATPR